MNCIWLIYFFKILLIDRVILRTTIKIRVIHQTAIWFKYKGNMWNVDMGINKFGPATDGIFSSQLKINMVRLQAVYDGLILTS